ncbi:hypothetical protein [Marinicella gelatinilytica]|uniref:hypothetical protein n=1 Tax=Marinicella gelatinilytica TaxID=2996017 RepID=UPI002260CC49|nr:hypothetical protein [Marinicella gelatinilytica]MCX7545063.1 hypothetical protein [Marinicella gelatinilytica]
MIKDRSIAKEMLSELKKEKTCGVTDAPLCPQNRFKAHNTTLNTRQQIHYTNCDQYLNSVKS